MPVVSSSCLLAQGRTDGRTDSVIIIVHSKKWRGPNYFHVQVFNSYRLLMRIGFLINKLPNLIHVHMSPKLHLSLGYSYTLSVLNFAFFWHYKMRWAF